MELTVLVNSCDRYEKLWPVFFETFHRFFPNCPYDICLNTETKTFSFPDLSLKCLHAKKANLTWSARLKDALDQIDTPYVLPILDDFILEEPVKAEIVSQCIERMKQDPRIGVVSLVVGQGIAPDKTYPEWEKQDKKKPYRINCQVAVWKKDYLKKILRDFESPWEFEKYGSIRSRRYKEEVYAWANEENYAFTYNWGKPIIGGKWNLDETDRLEAKLGVKFDLCGRETMRNYYEDLKNKPKPKRNLKWIWKKISHIKNRF